MDLRMIAFDLDGTLLNSQGQITPFTRSTLELAIRQGIQVVAASGRSLSALPDDVLAIEGINYAITSNGSSIFALSGNQEADTDTGMASASKILPDSGTGIVPDRKAPRRVYARDMEAAVIEAVLDIFEKTDFPFEAFIAGVSYTPRAYYDNPTAFGAPSRILDYVRRTRIPVDHMGHFIRAHIHEIEGMDMVVYDPVRKSEILKELAGIPNLYITGSESFYIELAAGGVSKASALHFLAEDKSLTPSQVMAFGNGDNDLEMLQYAGKGVAMKNSTPLLLARADDLTMTNDEDGVAHYIRKFL